MSTTPSLLVATHNQGKLREFQQVLTPLGFQVLCAKEFPDLPEPIEDGETFEANALLKAQSAFAHTGLIAMADDSGLVVPALQGEPGLYSARYAGVDGPDRDRHNRDFLKEKLRALPEADRAAHFHCSLVLFDGEQHFHFEGRCEGLLLLEDRGSHGFGYDPMFFVESKQKTMAELEPVVKNGLSHRADALQKLLQWIQETPSFRASLASSTS